MHGDQLQQLHSECERAIADLLLRHYPHDVPHGVSRLMATAAMAVLNAAHIEPALDSTIRSKASALDSKSLRWEIDETCIARVQEFIGQHKDNPFVEMRIRTNLNEDKPPAIRETFWEVLVGCLLTTQQRSGPGSAVARLIRTKPFPLPYPVCERKDSLATFVAETLTKFGGLRRTTRIGQDANVNMDFLRDAGWEETFDVLESVRLNPTKDAERTAARFIQDHFRGFGPKQSRNLLQGIGLTRFEIPIDSRIIKWTAEFGFPVKQGSNALSDKRYYEQLLDEFQRLCAACDILPCVLDAVIFSSFDNGAWTDENAVW